jgi:hypothetical protein
VAVRFIMSWPSRRASAGIAHDHVAPLGEPGDVVERAEGTEPAGDEAQAERPRRLAHLLDVAHQHLPAGLGRDERRPRELELSARLERDALLAALEGDGVGRPPCPR